MLEVRELTKRYGTNLAVDGLSFGARPGRVLGFLGPNGAGKTTTLRMLLGLTLPTSGAATVDGRALDDPNVGAVAYHEAVGLRQCVAARDRHVLADQARLDAVVHLRDPRA